MGFGGNPKALAPGSKLVIALCRKPFDDMEDDLPFCKDDANKKDGSQMDDEGHMSQDIDKLESTIINNSGILEYNKGNIGQFYHVEEVLALIDIANDGSKNQNNGQQQMMGGMVGQTPMGMDQQMHHQSDVSQIFHNEMMQVNHIS